MSDSASSSSRLLYRQEGAYNEAIPAPNPMLAVNFTKENFAPKNTTVDSNIIRSDGAVSDQYLVGTEVTGGYSFELAGADFDAFIAGVCRGTFEVGGANPGLLSTGTVATPSFQFEKGFLDIGQYIYLSGCTVDTLSLTVASRAIVLGDLTFMGAIGAITQATAATAITAASSHPSFTSGPGVSLIKVNGAAIGIGVKQIKLDIKNNLRARTVVDSLVSRAPGRGDLDITGSMDLYFSTAAMYNYYLANSALALTFTLTDNVGYSYDIVLPRIKASDDNAGQISGKNTDIMETFTFRALFDSVTGTQMQITRATF